MIQKIGKHGGGKNTTNRHIEEYSFDIKDHKDLSEYLVTLYSVYDWKNHLLPIEISSDWQDNDVEMIIGFDDISIKHTSINNISEENYLEVRLFWSGAGTGNEWYIFYDDLSLPVDGSVLTIPGKEVNMNELWGGFPSANPWQIELAISDYYADGRSKGGATVLDGKLNVKMAPATF
jgi:hypothetical protein